MKPTVVKPPDLFLCSGCNGLADPAAPSLLIGTLLLALTAVPAYIYWFGLTLAVGPTKWLIWTFSKVGLTRKLRRVPDEKVAPAKLAEAQRRQGSTIEPSSGGVCCLAATRNRPQPLTCTAALG